MEMKEEWKEKRNNTPKYGRKLTRSGKKMKGNGKKKK